MVSWLFHAENEIQRADNTMKMKTTQLPCLIYYSVALIQLMRLKENLMEMPQSELPMK